MVRGDLARIARLEAESFTTPWSLRTFEKLLSQPSSELWVAEEEARGVIGYYVLSCIQDQGEISTLAVDELVRGLGVGGRLLDHALKVARRREVDSVFLEVRTSNARAKALYGSRGFEPIGVRRGYYDRPREDAELLVKHLEAEHG
jgi:ribosomal-protein-alanine N-acetyltransferase